jgi:hypothetical protein
MIDRSHLGFKKRRCAGDAGCGGRWAKEQGAAFDLGRFHDAFLKQGALPMKLIRRQMLGSDGPRFPFNSAHRVRTP